MSDADRTTLIILEESTWGTAASGTYETLRHTSESLAQVTDTQESEEITDDRETADVIRTDIHAAGDINFELTYGTFDMLIAGALFSDWAADSIVNGVTINSFTLERAYKDVSGEFARYLGMMVDRWSMTFEANSIITGVFGLVGKNETSQSSAVDGSPNAKNANPVFNAIDDIDSVSEGGSSVSLLGGSFELRNNLRRRPLLGTLGPESIKAGNIDLTGTVRKYFASASLMDKYLNFNESSLEFTLNDGSNNQYVITFPAIKYTAGRRVAGGQNTDIVADMEWTAKKDTVTANMMKVVRSAGS